jgi:prolyl-tRNA synthetase
VPVRLELGARDLDQEQATVVRRDTMEKGPRPLGSLAEHVRGLQAEIQGELRRQARAFTEEHTIRPGSYDEMRSFLDASGGFAIASWCGSGECEAKVKAETKATIRYLPMDPVKPEGPCIVCGGEAVDEAAWARAY